MIHTPEQRRGRILALMETDEEYQKMNRDYEQAKLRFERFANYFPKKLRNLLWSYPGMLYLMYHRTLTLVSERMRFSDET